MDISKTEIGIQRNKLQIYLNIDIVDICYESYWVKQYSLSVIMYEVCRLMDSEYKSLGTYDVTYNACVCNVYFDSQIFAVCLLQVARIIGVGGNEYILLYAECGSITETKVNS